MNKTNKTEREVERFAKVAGRAIAKARRDGASAGQIEAMHHRAAKRVREIRAAG